RLQGEMGIVSRTHDLVQLFAGADANDFVSQLRCHGPGQVGYAHRGNLRHEDLAAMHALEISKHKIHALLQGNPETSHAVISNRQMIIAPSNHFLEERHLRTPRPYDIAVAHRTECGLMASRHVIGRYK